MAAKVMEKYLIQAEFKTQKGNVHDLKMEIEAVDAEAVWRVLRDIEKTEKETMLHARVQRVNPETGEAIVVRPKPVPLLPHQMNLDSQVRDAPAWYENRTAFGYAGLYVHCTPCTYKEKEETT